MFELVQMFLQKRISYSIFDFVLLLAVRVSKYLEESGRSKRLKVVFAENIRTCYFVM